MSEWIDFVKKYAKDNNVTYTVALKKAGVEYRKRKGVKGADNISRLSSKKMTKDFTTKKGTKLKTGKRKGDSAY